MRPGSADRRARRPRRPGAVAAVEPSATFVAAPRERQPGVESARRRPRQLPFGDDAFDAALASSSCISWRIPSPGCARWRARPAGRRGRGLRVGPRGERGPLATFWRAAHESTPFSRRVRPGGRAEGALAALFAEAGLSDIALGRERYPALTHATLKERRGALHPRRRGGRRRTTPPSRHAATHTCERVREPLAAICSPDASARLSRGRRAGTLALADQRLTRGRDRLVHRRAGRVGRRQHEPRDAGLLERARGAGRAGPAAGGSAISTSSPSCERTSAICSGSCSQPYQAPAARARRRRPATRRRSRAADAGAGPAAVAGRRWRTRRSGPRIPARPRRQQVHGRDQLVHAGAALGQGGAERAPARPPDSRRPGPPAGGRRRARRPSSAARPAGPAGAAGE